MSNLIIDEIDKLTKALSVQTNEVIDLQGGRDPELLRMKLALLEGEMEKLWTLADSCQLLVETHRKSHEAWVMLDDGVGRELEGLVKKEQIKASKVEEQ